MKKFPSLRPGSKLKVATRHQEFSGIFIPSPSKSLLTLKLESGYNISIEKSKIISIDVKSPEKPREIKKIIPQQSLKQNPSLPKISIISVGGTIASKVDYATGAVSPSLTPEEIINNVPELQSLAFLSCKQPCNIASESMRFGHYNALAKAIESEVKTKPLG